MPEWLKNLLTSLFGLFGESAGGHAPQGTDPQDPERQPASAPTPDLAQTPSWFELMGGVDDDVTILPSPSYDGSTTLSDAGWNGLRPSAKEAWGVLTAACSKIGIDLKMDEGYRPRRRQAYLYAQGRTRQDDGTWAVSDKTKIVTNAKPGKSIHQSGLAFDVHIVLPPDGQGRRKASYDEATLARVAVVAKEQGLKWGGDFKLASGGADNDHFEVPA